MRTTRQRNGFSEKMTRSSVEVYSDYVAQHRNHFYFMCQSRGGGTPALRDALRNELKFFANELAADLSKTSNTNAMATDDLNVACQLLVETVFDSTIDLLDLIDSNPRYREEFNERLIKKLRFIWLGLDQWDSQPVKASSQA